MGTWGFAGMWTLCILGSYQNTNVTLKLHSEKFNEMFICKGVGMVSGTMRNCTVTGVPQGLKGQEKEGLLKTRESG